jgi:hypothetical protein
MSDGFIVMPPDSTGKKIDTTELTVSGSVVERQRINIADPVNAGLFATVTASGALKVDGSAVTQPVSSVAQGTPGAVIPTTAFAVGGTDGTNLRVLSVSNTGVLKVDGSAVTQPVSGTVTANIGTTNGLALDSSVNGLVVAQGSVTSGEKGHLTQGAVTTSSPTYTTGQTNPLSLTTAGALRVDGSNVVQGVNTEGQKATYSSPILNFPCSTSFQVGDILSIAGSASKTIRIIKIMIHGYSNTAAINIPLFINKQSSLDVQSGSPSGGNIRSSIPHDTNSPTATATIRTYLNQITSQGTVVGNIIAKMLYLAVQPAVLETVVFDFSVRNDQALVLRGASENICINLGPTSFTNPAAISVYIEWTEE